jgi:hypothetical protein
MTIFALSEWILRRPASPRDSVKDACPWETGHRPFGGAAHRAQLLANQLTPRAGALLPSLLDRVFNS